MTKQIQLLFLSVLFTSCNKGVHHRLPANIEKSLIGSWVVRPAKQSNTIVIHRLREQHDRCNVLRFTEQGLHWYYLDRADTIPHLDGVNKTIHDERSTWEVDRYAGTIDLHKIETSVNGVREQKTRYFLYQFSPDTFTLQMDRHLTLR